MMQSTVNTPITELVRLEDLSEAITPVAMLRQEPIKLARSNHHGCPEPGTEICVATKPENAAILIDRTQQFQIQNEPTSFHSIEPHEGGWS